MPTLKRHDGELHIDNRASGGPVPQFGQMTEIRAATVRCWHCGGVWMVNPLRERPRNYCRKCDAYLCDGCGLQTKEPGYAHRSFDELSDMVTSGKFQIVGGTPSAPILVPTQSLIISGD